MSRIQKTFEQLKYQHKKALIPFITAGDPNIACTLKLMFALVKGGADMIELGIPFSDPMADGPVIQRASERALKHGVCLVDILELVRAFREFNQHTPIILMGYANPIEQIGLAHFAQSAALAGVDGVLIVDYATQELNQLYHLLQGVNIDLINLVSPTTPLERINKIAQVTSGYVYYVSLKGVTGAGNLDIQEIASKIQAIKLEIALPIAVGFGIRDAKSAAKVAQYADAVVLGSRLVSLIETTDEAKIEYVLTALMKEIRDALDCIASTSNALMK